MIIAIFGLSCTGKTTIANRLAAEYAVQSRNCGREFIHAAGSLSTTMDESLIALHNRIDFDTIQLCESIGNGICIIEGRYLNQVLANVRHPMVLIELTSSSIQRIVRKRARDGSHFEIESIHAADEADTKLRKLLYPNRSCLAPDLSIDATTLSIENCSQLIKSYLSKNNYA